MKLLRNTIITAAFILMSLLLITPESAYADKVKRVSVIGDSISSYQGYSDIFYYSPVKMPVSEMYWQRFIDSNSDMELGSINAIGGSNVYAPCDESCYDWTMQSNYRIDKLDNNGVPDIVIAFGGINDKSDDLMLFCNAYYNMIHRIREMYPNTMIICVAPYYYDGADNGSIDFIAQVIKNASDEDRNSIYVDLRDKLRGYIGSPYMQTEGEGCWFHPNAKGHKIIADAIQNEYKQHENEALAHDTDKEQDINRYNPKLELRNVAFVPGEDCINLAASYYGEMGSNTKFCYEVTDTTTGIVERSDWINTSGWWKWYPDSNDYYSVKVSVSINGDGYINESMIRNFYRPEMNIKVTGTCAMPTKTGLLYGCTSTGVSENYDGARRLRTCCWIYSYTQKRWITLSAFEGANQAWYRTRRLPNGVYVMYNSTEEMDANGNWRKLSTRFYNFTIG